MYINDDFRNCYKILYNIDMLCINIYIYVDRYILYIYYLFYI